MKKDGSAIRKVQFWFNPTSVGGKGPRWDANVTTEDGKTERRTRITLKEAVAILRAAIR